MTVHGAFWAVGPGTGRAFSFRAGSFEPWVGGGSGLVVLSLAVLGVGCAEHMQQV